MFGNLHTLRFRNNTETSGALFASGGRQMYLSEAYILMMSELACAGGLVIMNGKGAIRSTVGLAIAFVAYTILLGLWGSFFYFEFC